MKVCKLCGSTYGDRVDFCFRDGNPLVTAEAAPAPAPGPVRGRPGLADMLDVVEPGFARMPSADPTDLPFADAPVVQPAAPPAAPVSQEQQEALAAFAETEAGAEFEVETQVEELLPLPVETEIGGAPLFPLVEPDEGDGSSAPGPAAEDGAEVPAERPVDPAPEQGADGDGEAMAAFALGLGSSAAAAPPSPPDPAPVGPPSATALPERAEPRPAPRPAPQRFQADEDEDLPPPPREKSKVVPVLFGGALLLGLFGVGAILLMPGEEPDQALAGSPQQTVASRDPAPAPAVPAPDPLAGRAAAAPEAAVAGSDGGTDELVPVGPTTPPLVAPPLAGMPVSGTPTTGATTPPPGATPAARPVAPPVTPPPPVAPPPTVAPPTAALPTGDASADLSSNPWNTQASTGRLTINTIPAGALVYVDDRQLGRSPLSAELNYGMHTVRVELGGYGSEKRTIDVQVPEMAMPFDLKALVVTGTVNIFGPTGATVYVDGAQVGKIPTSVKLTEGAHSFRVETPEGSSFNSSKDVRFEAGSTVSVTLSP